MKIMFLSNSAWSSSGYGMQIKEVAPRLKEMGYEVAVTAFFGLQGGRIEYDGIPHFPAGFQPYGNDVIIPNAMEWGADIVIPLMDIWVLNPQIFQAVRMVPWCPIDHSPVPREVLMRMKSSFAALGFSQFAMQELANAGVAAQYIPHGVNTDIFHPMKPAEKKLIRAEYGLEEDAFIVGMVAANQDPSMPTRKGYERILPAITQLRYQGGYDKLYLYIHTHPGRDMGGVPLIDIINSFDAGKFVYLPRPGTFEKGGVSREELAKLYNAFDLYACPSMSEGFGVPILESAACGIPSIATKFASMSELCFSGWTIEPITDVMTPLLAFQVIPSISSIAERIAYAYDHRDEVKEKGKQSHLAAQDYSWDNVMETYWRPALSNIEARLHRSHSGLSQLPQPPQPPQLMTPAPEE